MACGDKSPLRYMIPEVKAENPHVTRYSERKSVFLAQSSHCANPECARAFIANIKATHTDATHNCWAFTAGPPGDTAFVGSADDGEPRGSAGRPMLKTLLGGPAGEICVVVSRWFGGIKLGLGGLSRAYQTAVSENLASLPLIEKRLMLRYKLALGYEKLESLRRLLPEFGATIEESQYADKALLIIATPCENAENFIKAVLELTNGTFRPELLPQEAV